ncbi:carboxypeptidase-like regulatory domain-containing protein [Spirosoma sp. BT702]|uniref:Carboxypeptidase-like regulatory domain-containing protein n=1 Tax=Spirosoma profusum TaxID=2771354 RepID=A0A926XWA4_9BACT|nr:carboxypeptidase-like regulatory domain-containing protein [Spirosoma profusum]
MNTQTELNKSLFSTRNDVNTERTALNDSLKNTVSGKILDAETNEPLAGVIVTLRKGNNSTTTDKNGLFTLNIPENSLTDLMAFGISFVGYIYQEYEFKRQDLPIHKDQIFLHGDITLLGEVVIIKQKRKW